MSLILVTEAFLNIISVVLVLSRKYPMSQIRVSWGHTNLLEKCEKLK